MNQSDRGVFVILVVLRKKDFIVCLEILGKSI